jgi:hypothetical protein
MLYHYAICTMSHTDAGAHALYSQHTHITSVFGAARAYGKFKWLNNVLQLCHVCSLRCMLGKAANVHCVQVVDVYTGYTGASSRLLCCVCYACMHLCVSGVQGKKVSISS